MDGFIEETGTVDKVEIDILNVIRLNKICCQVKTPSLSSQLERCLLDLNRQPHLWHFPAFVSAWNFLLLQPFSSGGNGSDGERREVACKRSLELLSRCPLSPSDLDIKTLEGECRRLGMNALADEFVGRKTK